MEDLIDTAEEFLKSGEENLEKNRFNVAVSDFFKAIVIFCDYLIYKEIKILPKNHVDRFSLLNTHFKEIYSKISNLFRTYTQSYNQKLNRTDGLNLKKYAYELRDYIKNKR
jgi:uncharacterized protein (UPF0332 family)